jgi:hypothetical protein
MANTLSYQFLLWQIRIMEDFSAFFTPSLKLEKLKNQNVSVMDK